jgi:hypothetical protein
MSIGKIEKVSKLREIWKNEAKDFTPWLAVQENLDILSEEIGIQLVNAEIEQRAGGFSCDIKCEVESDNRIVVIENQIEQSNHDHLGKTIVYASDFNAKLIIWIVKDARPEHAKAIEWLNENTDSQISFYLIEIHAIKIGDSDPAPLFKIIEQPNLREKIVKNSKDKQLKRSEISRFDFWSGMNNYIDNSNYRLNTRKPSYDHWYDFAMESSDYHMSVNLLDKDNKIRVLLYIHEDKNIFDYLYSLKDKIEKELSEYNLFWERKDEKKASSVDLYIENFSYDNKDNWESLYEEVVLAIVKTKSIYLKYLKKR